MAGPRPQARLNRVDGSGAVTWSRDRAGIVSLARPRTGCPCCVPAWAADDQPGKLRSIWSVTSGGENVATPPSPIVAERVPKKLVTLILGGAAAKPYAGCITILEIRRKLRQFREMTGLVEPEIHGVVVALKRLSGPNSGSDPHVELALTSSEDFFGGATLPTRFCRAVLGCATAIPLTCRRSGTGRVNRRAIGIVAPRSAWPAGTGAAWWNENPTESADPTEASCAGWRYRVTRTPGIRTSLTPAPGFPGTTLLAPVMVIRSHLVGPARTRSCCVSFVGIVVVVTWPAAVLTRSWFAMDRLALWSSGWMPMLTGRSI